MLHGDLIVDFQCLKAAHKKEGGRRFPRACWKEGRTKQKEFKQRESKFKLDSKRKLFTVRVVRPLERVAQRSCGCTVPGSVQGQIRWGSKQPGPLEPVPGHGSGAGTR